MRMGGRGKIGLGTIVLALVAMYFGIDPGIVLQNATAPVDEASYDNGPASPATPETRFVSKVLADTEDAWGAIFQPKGWGHSQQAKLVLLNGAPPTACGTGQSALGPHRKSTRPNPAH